MEQVRTREEAERNSVIKILTSVKGTDSEDGFRSNGIRIKYNV